MIAIVLASVLLIVGAVAIIELVRLRASTERTLRQIYAQLEAALQTPFRPGTARPAYDTTTIRLCTRKGHVVAERHVHVAEPADEYAHAGVTYRRNHQIEAGVWAYTEVAQ